VFGAIGAYERYFLPVLGKVMRDENTEDFFVFAEEAFYTSHIAYAPVVCTGVVSSDCEDTVAEMPFDQWSGGVAMGGGSRTIGLFMSTSWSLTTPSHELYMGSGLTPFMPLLSGWVLLAGEDAYASAFPGSIDGVLAGYVNAGPVQATAGYVLSQGVFGDLNVPRLRTFAQAVITNQFAELGQLKTGIRDLSIAELVGDAEEAVDTFGRTAAYVRNAKLKPPNLEDVGVDPELVGRDFWTAHLDQWNIAEIIDLEAAYAFASGGFFHKGLFAIHTPEMPERLVYASGPGSSDGEDFSVSAYGSIGFVELPELWYYGVAGGRSVALSAEVAFGNKRGGGKFFVRRNDPEFLKAFPYGQDAVNSGFMLYLHGL
jgi:hypothetical protein